MVETKNPMISDLCCLWPLLNGMNKEYLLSSHKFIACSLLYIPAADTDLRSASSTSPHTQEDTAAAACHEPESSWPGTEAVYLLLRPPAAELASSEADQRAGRRWPALVGAGRRWNGAGTALAGPLGASIRHGSIHSNVW